MYLTWLCGLSVLWCVMASGVCVCACACVFVCVVWPFFLNMFVFFVWDVLCDDVWLVLFFVLARFADCGCAWCLWSIV